jgi:hypothetical protein
MSNSFAWTRNHQINTLGLDGADGTARQAREQESNKNYYSHIILVGGAAVRGHSGQNDGVGRSSFILLR